MSKNFKDITESSANLSPLETFDKDVFKSDSKYSQELCNFVLTLALIWNDNKNLNVYNDFIEAAKPKGVEFVNPKEMPITTLWGELSGHLIYLEKMQIALIHELCEVIKNSKNVLVTQIFNEIVKQRQKIVRESWRTIVDFANGASKFKSPFGNALFMIRNKIANHYDPKEIYKGYVKKFSNPDTIPFISRGSAMCEHRFYFADAAAQEYYRSFQDNIHQEIFYKNFNIIRNNLNLSIAGIVQGFIQKRSPWRKY
jgi:hypothetical protein